MYGMNDKTDIFLEYRSLLFSVAYNMLGSVANAEDMVQETYLKWMDVDHTVIKNTKAYLVRIVTNECINFLKSAQAKHVAYVGVWLPEPIVDQAPNAAQQSTESYHALSIGLLMLMEKLTPRERAIFILREVFAYDYKELSEIFEKTEDNCRQIFKRAKENLGRDMKRFEVDLKVHEKMLQQFLTAAEGGNAEMLIALLKEDIVLFAEGGAGIAVNGQRLNAPHKPIYGKEAVTKFVLSIVGKVRTHLAGFRRELVMTNGLPSVINYIDNVPINLISYEWDGEQLKNIYIQANPDKLKVFTRP